MTTTVLNEATNLASSSHDERIRVLRLSENYTRYNIYELIARISDVGVTLTKLDDTENDYDEDVDPIRRPPAKNYNLTADEADAFCDAWVAYKTDRTIALEAEVTRKAGVLAEALKLGAELGLKIETIDSGIADNPNYKVKHPHRHVEHSYCYGPDGLLGSVKAFQAELEQERKTVEEAGKLAEKITEMCGDVITIAPHGPAQVYYNLKIEGRFAHCSVDQFHPTTMVNRLKAILDDLEREQAQKTSALS